MLPVLDDLERALGSVPDELAGSSWVDGIRHIYRKLQAALEAQGISVIEAEGKDFDPNFHEAVMTVEGEEGKVIKETQKGYQLRNRVIRPTKVKVGKGSESPGNNA
jgi:molecular chaperone GrpE